MRENEFKHLYIPREGKVAPETTRQVTNSRTQHRVCEEIGSPRDQFPLQIPAMHATWRGGGQERESGRTVSGASDDVKIMCFLLSEVIILEGKERERKGSGQDSLYELGNEFRLTEKIHHRKERGQENFVHGERNQRP